MVTPKAELGPDSPDPEADPFYGVGVTYAEQQRQLEEAWAQVDEASEAIRLPVLETEREFGDQSLDDLRARWAPETVEEAASLATAARAALRRGGHGVKLHPEIAQLLDELHEASRRRTLPAELRDEAILAAGALARWLEGQIEDRQHPGTPVQVTGRLTADGGAIREVRYSRGRVVRQRLSAEEVAAEEAQRLEQEVEAAKFEGEITPADVAQWSADRWMRFRTAHPDLADRLLAGQSVQVR